jgi:NTE family protein
MLPRRGALSAVGAAATAPLWLGRAGGKAHQARRIGVALGSGGLHGLAYVGAIRALQHFGFRPDVITGCSVGAIAGALWAAGLDTDAIESFALDTSWQQENRWRMPQFGFANLQRLQQLIEQRTSGARIEALGTRFAAVATDLATGQGEVLRHGPLAPAVAASACVPIRYEPVDIGGRRMVDGALTAPLPVDATRMLGADFVIAIDVAYRPYEEAVTGITDVAFQMFHIMVNQLIAEQARRADYLIRLDVHAQARSPDRGRALAQAGEQAVRDAWPALRRELQR